MNLHNSISLFLKFLFDFFVSFIALIVLSPFLLIISLMILIFLGKPIFFIQKRAGKGGKTFYLFKFRTMKNQINNMSDKDRMTYFGSLLRDFSIDELPSLVNIIRGEMSIVGPRPLLEEYLDIYTDDQKKRHELKPGLTGWAQINGRNDISWEKKFEYDLWYIKNRSFYLDLKIIFKTIIKVITKEDIKLKGEVTTKKFEK